MENARTLSSANEKRMQALKNFAMGIARDCHTDTILFEKDGMDIVKGEMSVFFISEQNIYLAKALAYLDAIDIAPVNYSVYPIASVTKVEFNSETRVAVRITLANETIELVFNEKIVSIEKSTAVAGSIISALTKRHMD